MIRFDNERVVFLQDTIKKQKRRLAKAPSGYLRIAERGGKPQYYHVESKSQGPGKYLDSRQLDLAKKLAQKSYDKKVLRAAEQELKAWTMLASFFPDQTLEEIYGLLSPSRQSLVCPLLPTDEEYRKAWEAVDYEPGWFKKNEPEYWTDRDERVRSKSEQLIANLLYRLGIPYRYEYPIKIKVNGKTEIWRPDFMILDIKHRKEFFLEHLGMLDGPEYARNAFHKMMVYEQNGLYEGQGMYYSYETGGAPLDIRYVETVVRRVLSKETGGVPHFFSTSPAVETVELPDEFWGEPE